MSGKRSKVTGLEQDHTQLQSRDHRPHPLVNIWRENDVITVRTHD